jgi:hypothetical protein
VKEPVQILVPVEGLRILVSADIGPVRLLAPDQARELARRQPPVDHLLSDDLEEGLASGAALVRADSPAEALDLIASALAVIRAYQQTISIMRTAQFGIPGDAWSARVPFLVLGQSTAAAGWTHRGHHRGVAFTEAQRAGLAASPGFQLASSAIGSATPNDGQRRALLGVDLTSRALLETRPDLQLLHAVLAAEAMLLERRHRSQSLLLARRAAYLLCGRRHSSLCGRDRPTCPLLGTSPESRRGRDELKPWMNGCSEWANVLHWYDLRSDVAHGGRTVISEQEASSATFWVTTRLLPQALEWFADHPGEPLADLEAAIVNLPDPPRDENGNYIL